MEWRGRRGSRNVEDRRGMGRAGAGGLSVAGILVVLAVAYFFGIDISPIMGAIEGAGQGGGQGAPTRELTAAERETGEFASVVLADTEEVWARVLREQAGRDYRAPRMVLFSGQVDSACGGASAAMGPFYCPGDESLYLDTDFFQVMRDQMGAGGDFAAAYVIAHEVGHHVQNLLGTLGQVNAMRARLDRGAANRLSVLTELQADCHAGIWARRAQQMLGTIEPGDIDEAIRAAAAVGDDVLMKKAGRAPMPDAFTHGSAAQRQEWFMRGHDSGRLEDCDSFAAAQM